MSRIEPRVAALECLYAAESVEAGEPDVAALGRRAAALASGTWARRVDLDAEVQSH